MELCRYPCPIKTRTYDIEAIELPIVYNKYGDHDPNGLIYVLKKDANRIRENALRNFSQKIPQPSPDVVPLVIRANIGDTVVIHFSHSLNRALSLHVLGMDYDVQTSDGADVGYNKDSTTSHRITYTWYAREEGVFLFHDMGDTRSSEEGTNVHGLFGAIIVEAAEAKWLSPKPGQKLKADSSRTFITPQILPFASTLSFFTMSLR